MTEGRPTQKERFSRAWVIAAASAADFTYRIVTDDEHGVDMTIHDDYHSLDFQLKATSHPTLKNDSFIFYLDVRTYNLLRQKGRAGYSVLALIVVGSDTSAWHKAGHEVTRLSHAAYFLPLYGYPATKNKAKVRLEVPRANLLTADAMRSLMQTQAARWEE